jgi:hypothetical protein
MGEAVGDLCFTDCLDAGGGEPVTFGQSRRSLR